MRYITRFNPMQDIVNLQDAFERALDIRWPYTAASNGNKSSYRLPLDVFDHEDTYTIFASLPGVSAENIEINLEDNVLSIQANLPETQVDESAQPLWRERRFGQFLRQISLPAPIHREAITADYVNGVLKLTLPKAESARVHQIPVRSVQSNN